MIDFLALSTEPAILGLVDNLIETTIFSSQEDASFWGALNIKHTNIVSWKSEQWFRLEMHLSQWVSGSGCER